MTAFTDAIASQAQGGPAATAAKNQAAHSLIGLLRQLAMYVQTTVQGNENYGLAELLAMLARQVMAQLELRRQTRELAESERFLRTIFDSSPACMKVLGPDGSLRMMSRAGLAMLEAESFAEVAGHCIYPLVVPEHRPQCQALTERVFRGETGTLDYQIVGLKGTMRWLETHAAPLRDDRGEVSAMLGITRDITRRKQAEEASQASETRYRTLFEHAPDGILIVDPQCRFVDANVGICRMLGYSRDALTGMHVSDILRKEDASHVVPALNEIKGTSNYRHEWYLRRKDDSQFAAEVIAAMTPDGNLMALIRDSTERKRSEARFRWLVDSNAQGVMFWNMKGEITEANDAFLRIVGYDREDLEAGRIHWVGMTPPGYAEQDRQTLEELAARGVCTPIEKEYLRKDGSRVTVLRGAATFADNPEEGVSFVLDLTERKKSEQQALRAQRMESIGTLADGIAHDLNNELAPIMMSIAMLEVRFPDPTSQNLLAHISSSAQRAADMVRQVLSFARGVEGRRMKLQVKHLIREIEKIANDTFLKHIEVSTNVARGLWTVVSDPTQLHQVLLNLCVNARDAMPDGGTLTLSAHHLALDAHYAALNLDVKPGPYRRRAH